MAEHWSQLIRPGMTDTEVYRAIRDIVNTPGPKTNNLPRAYVEFLLDICGRLLDERDL